MELTERTLNALKWNYAGVFAKAVAQFAIGVILARLLGPKPFGVYSVVLLVSGLGALAVDRGLGSAVIQSRDLTEEEIRYAFTRLVLTSSAIGLLLSLAASLLAELFRYPQLTTAVYGSALYLLVYSTAVIPSALLQRKLDMKSLQIAQLTAYLVGYGIVGIGSALSGLQEWSLIAALLAQWSTFMAIVYAKVRPPIRPLLRLSKKHISAFGNQVLATNLLNWTIENADNLLVGRAFGMSALGLYSVSYNLVRIPTNHVMTTAQGVLFAAGSRSQDNLGGLQRSYLTALSGVLLLTCPMFFGIAAVSRTTVEAIYGQKWMGAEVLVLPLSLAMPVHASITGSVLLWARGQVLRELVVEAGTAIVLVSAVAVASQQSLQAVGWAVLGVYIIRAGWLTSRILDSLLLPWASFWRAARGGLLLGLAVAAVLFVVDASLREAGFDPTRRLGALFIVALVVTLILPSRVRPFRFAAELSAVLERASVRSPLLLRKIVQLYVKA